MRRCQPRFLISLMCCVLALCLQAYAVQKMWSPTAFTWMEAWQRMAASPLMHPQLAGARMLLPLQVEDRPGTFLIDLVRGGEVIGLFFVRRDWQSIQNFALTDTPYREGAVAVPADRAEQVAREFVTTFYPDTPGTLRVRSYPQQDLHGHYAFEFQYRVQDVCIRSISIGVSHDGYIVSAGDYDLRTKQGVDILKEITKSPGANVILAQTRQYLHDNGFPDASIAEMYRTIEFLPGDVKPVFAWQGSAARVEKGKTLTADITYAEATQQFTRSPWRDPEGERDTRPFTPVRADHPVWTPDGSGLWWMSGVHWRGLPAWIPSPPYSLVTCKLTGPGSRPVLYRPVPDIDTLSLGYAYPSISPDQRWMTTMVFSRVHLVVDLLNNRLYVIPGDHFCRQRISWRSDSRQVVFVDANEEKLYWLDVIGKTGIPFDVPERRVALDVHTICAEFLPGNLNTVFAVIRSPDAEGEAQDWHLAMITLPELKDTPSVTPPKDDPTEPDADGNAPRRMSPVTRPGYSDRIEVKGAVVEILHKLPERVSYMHVLPDGSGAIIALPDGLHTFSLNTRTLTPISWLAKGREVAPDTYFTNSEWDVSPDGRQIAFAAYTKAKGPGGVICVANIDGTNIRRVSGGIEDRLERFRLQGRYYYVPKHQIAFGLMGRLSIPQFQDIEWPIITWGPWYRRLE